ncbi:hypothetical protein CR513_21451, partial [Mucuna pruriens]
MSPYWIVFEPTRLSNSANWPMIKQGSKGNSSCKSWMNFAWKPMKAPRSTSRKSSTSMTNIS